MTHRTKCLMTLDRRALLAGGSAWLAALAAAQFDPAFGQDVEGELFTADDVKKQAEALAASNFSRPTVDVVEPFQSLTAEQFRDIRFRAEQAIWRGEKLDTEVQLLSRGWIYETPVEIRIVEAGKARALTADQKLFVFGKSIESAPDAAPFAFSGFRLHGPLNRADVYDGYAVFQGASYFRAVGRGQTYGLSARGLAINCAQPAGEEFPIFRAFWIEKPSPAASDVVVHALLDSPSVAGAYRFVIRPGQATVVDVDMTLYPRVALTHVGVGPLTSMFLHGPAHRRVGAFDTRPAVHNSEGLAVLNGRGERLWRPLTNPKTLQTSAFIDKNPKGFGLVQRDRSFQVFDDVNARFEQRPSVWVEPRGGWGDGYVELVEIPAEEEIHDNIVAYWKPSKELETGKAHRFAYRLHWGDDVPVAWSAAEVSKTSVAPTRNKDVTQFVVDFKGPAVRDVAELPVAEVSASTGAVSNTTVQRHPDIAGVRVAFDLNTAGADLIELRLGLKDKDQQMSESWLYRWTAA